MPRDLPDGRHLVTQDIKYTEGYLKTEIEFHNDSLCRYKDNGSEAKHSHRVYYHIRNCQCTRQLPKIEEKHFEKQCKWKRVIDEKTGKAVLYRRCFCTKLE